MTKDDMPARYLGWGLSGVDQAMGAGLEPGETLLQPAGVPSSEASPTSSAGAKAVVKCCDRAHSDRSQYDR